MARYHIKDDGTPGKCSAATQDSCPKTQAGDSFHTENLQEALRESERRFEAKLSGFATQSKGEEAIEAQAGDFVERYEAAAMLLGEDPTDAEASQQLQELQDELSAHSRSRSGVGNRILADSRYEEATIAVSKLKSSVGSPLEAAKINGQLQRLDSKELLS